MSVMGPDLLDAVVADPEEDNCHEPVESADSYSEEEVRQVMNPDALAYAKSDLADAVEAIPERYRAQAIAWVQNVYVNTKHSPEEEETPVLITASKPSTMEQFHALSEYIAYAEHPDRIGKPSGKDGDGYLFRVAKSGEDVFYLETQKLEGGDWVSPNIGIRMPITAIDDTAKRIRAESKLLAAEAEFLTEMGWIPHASTCYGGTVTWSHEKHGGLYSQQSAIKAAREDSR